MHMLQDKLCTQAVTLQYNSTAKLRLDSIARHVNVHVQKEEVN
jgi:hypothetical protein